MLSFNVEIYGETIPYLYICEEEDTAEMLR